ncbi:MAG: sulfite exporter TauE/SafE family protein [Gammaproteobacteria bacterium]|jgi:hypothetical protein|nr:sulfite exporter TauE/SafE family protein [Gammaproteobacteria bacterium]
MTAEILAAVAIGFAGAGHCIGMCGGISAALTLGVNNQRHQILLYSLLFNLGRIISYAIVGALLGGLAASIQLNQYLQESLYLAGTMLILMGLSIAQLWHGVRRIEVLGKGIWQLIQPLSKHLMPIQSLKQALLLGLLWGWLPCGLIYSSLIWASTSANWQHSAILMLAFGIGTLPANLASGILAEQLKALLRKQLNQRLLGLMMISLGLYTLPIWP